MVRLASPAASKIASITLQVSAEDNVHALVSGHPSSDANVPFVYAIDNHVAEVHRPKPWTQAFRIGDSSSFGCSGLLYARFRLRSKLDCG
ncbi:ATPase [Pseudozyma hubeiensis SY62]|uniref:ATPase n=1 Tax=Pseudozyma hubeiensis (strain SY62) TaxID=1305764 RepID=R9P5M1_PSEHS|nr:ATPase [Pseudozyma hubeiensis SY62]GAC96624.1 ATPase [Pseudozyma hubeiensis SY62]